MHCIAHVGAAVYCKRKIRLDSVCMYYTLLYMRVLATRRWLEKIVIGQKLCPFAPPVRARLRLCGSDARNEDEVVAKVAKEARLLHDGIEMQTRQPGAAVTETTLVVLPSLECTATWQAFVRLSWRLQAEAIADAGLAHALQLVLFHPSAVHSAYGEGPRTPPTSPSARRTRRCICFARWTCWPL